MVQRALSALLAAALLLSGAAPRALLQGAAWASMIARTAPTLGLAAAAEAALRGDAPCRLCLKARALAEDSRPSLAAAERVSQDAPQPGRSPAVAPRRSRVLFAVPVVVARPAAGFSSPEPQPPSSRLA